MSTRNSVALLDAAPQMEVVEQHDPKLHDGDGDFPPLDFDEGGRPGRCDWNLSVCTDDPTYRVVKAGPDGEPLGDEDPSIFCGRHYGAWLARWVSLHEAESGCKHPHANHFYYYGPIAGADLGSSPKAGE